ncbi:MAG: hypothetical protein J5472_06445 [Clostridia bacterium]|nr:hypothetical protein [Clostridia bacterium]
MKKYEAPELFVDTFAADTMIASNPSVPKNGNASNNQNCWGCDMEPYKTDSSGQNGCVYDPTNNAASYNAYCT